MDAKQVHFLIERMDRLREEIKRDTHAAIAPVARIAGDNLKRIETLERWQSKVMGMAILGGGLGAWFVKAVLKI